MKHLFIESHTTLHFMYNDQLIANLYLGVLLVLLNVIFVLCICFNKLIWPDYQFIRIANFCQAYFF